MIWLQPFRSRRLMFLLFASLSWGTECKANDFLPSKSDGALSAPTPLPIQATPDTQLPRGFPNSTNTGPSAGMILKTYSGNYEVRNDGAVVSGLKVTGSIVVSGNNVTADNCEVNASGQ